LKSPNRLILIALLAFMMVSLTVSAEDTDTTNTTSSTDTSTSNDTTTATTSTEDSTTNTTSTAKYKIDSIEPEAGPIIGK